MVITDILRKLVSNSSLNGADQLELTEAIGLLDELGLTATSEAATAAQAQAAANAKAAQVAALEAQLAALKGDPVTDPAGP